MTFRGCSEVALCGSPKVFAWAVPCRGRVGPRGRIRLGLAARWLRASLEVAKDAEPPYGLCPLKKINADVRAFWVAREDVAFLPSCQRRLGPARDVTQHRDGSCSCIILGVARLRKHDRSTNAATDG